MKNNKLPKEWKEVKLEDICELIRNGTSIKQNIKKLGYKVTRIETISGGYIDMDKVGYVCSDNIEEYKLKKGDILFSNINSIEHVGKTAIYDSEEDLYHGMNLLLFRCNNNVNSYFIHHLLKSDRIRNFFRGISNRAVNQVSINQKQVRNFKIPLPPLAEQEKIADILSCCDEVIENTSELIEQKTLLKKGLMQQLLTGKTRCPGFTGEWKEVKLGDVCEILSSKRIYAKEYVKSGIPFYRSKEIIDKFNHREINIKLYISKDKFDNLKNKFGAPEEGDILITSVGTLGIPYLVKKETFYFKDGNLVWLKNFKNSCYSIFIYHWFLSNIAKYQINNVCIGSSQKALTINTLQNFKIPLPPLAEQEKIADILSCCDDEIELLNNELENLRLLKKGLMQQLLTGKIRVMC